MDEEIDTMNKFLVAAQGDQIRLMKPLNTAMISKDDALNLAAWLVALADDDGKFQRVLEAVQNT